MLTLGCDEAGRGPVLGPLVVAGAVFDKKDLKTLKELGIKDSKQLTKNRRNQLYKKIKEISKNYKIIKITPSQLNQLMEIMTLNEIEMNAMINIINSLNTDKVIIDLPSTSKTFIPLLKSKLNKPIKLTAEHKADDKYIEVSAASILAKVERDKEIEKLKQKYKDYNDIGSGYPSDPKTISFLKEHLKEHKKFPEETRTKWSTCERLLEELNLKPKQKSLNLW